MKLDCQITELLQRDFNSVWKCKILGETLEISTPYLLPDATLFSLFLTTRGDRYIACDGGSVWELLSEYCAIPEEEVRSEVESMARKFQVKTGSRDKKPIFFKDCTDPKLISSIAFDVANFAVMATSALVSASSEEPGVPLQDRFERKADRFLRSVVPSDFEWHPREIPEVPSVRFGAVLVRASRVWLISFVTGSNTSYFRRSVNDTAKSFQHAWKSALGTHDRLRTIPLVNTEARGFDSDKLGWQLNDLATDSHESLVRWDEKDMITRMLRPLTNAEETQK
jgi:hypothetical protein